MNEEAHPTRRRFLAGSAAVLAGVASAGCGSQSERGETPSPSSPEPSTDAVTTTGSGAATTTTATASGTATADEPASEGGLKYDFDRPMAAFEQLLVDRFVAVQSLDVVDDRVRLRYVAQSDRGHEVAAGIETVVVSFIQVYRHDWDVEAVDAAVVDRHDTDAVMGHWRLESRWVEYTVDGDWSRTDLLRRTLNSYRGDLRRSDGHHHGSDSSDHSHEEEDHHHEEETHHGNETSDHAHEETTHSHGNETSDHSH